MSESELPVLIIGAGTGGLALAHGLRRAGIPVQVFERDRTRTSGLHGYRVGISPNGVRGLRACLPPELFDTFVATTARDFSHFNLYTERLRRLVSFSSDYLLHQEGVVKDYSVSRMTLRQVLLTGLEDIVAFDKKFTHFVQHQDRVIAFFEDGSRVTGRLLVGADGASSRVRAQYLPDATQSDTGLVAIGGKVALTEPVRQLLPPAARNSMSMFFDRHGQLGVLHVMELPWRAAGDRADGIGGNDAELLARWPGLLFDNTTDYISWGVSTSRTLLPDGVLDMDGAALRELVHGSVVADWHPSLRELVRQCDPSTMFAVNVRTSDPLTTWTPSRVTLLGDAAHTMTPGRGAGANTALRDAALLRDKLVEAHTAPAAPAAELLEVAAGQPAAGSASGPVEPADESAEPTALAALTAAVGDYEQRMRAYSALAVRESLEFMNDGGLARRPVIGPLSTLSMRTMLRIVDRVPALKRRMARRIQRVRDSDLEPA